ncbi:TetR/AcrR family transcriptional regulator [Streptomyces sp. NPDC055037]
MTERPTSAVLNTESLPRRQRERRQAIVDAAVLLLSGRTYAQVQIRDVAREADVALGTLYRYFTSKDHLYASVLREWGLDLEDRSRLTAGAVPSVRLREKAEQVVAAFRAEPQIFALYEQLSVSSEPVVVDLVSETARSGRSWFAQELGGETAEEDSRILWSTVAIAVRDPEVGDRVIDRYFQLLTVSLANPQEQSG